MEKSSRRSSIVKTPTEKKLVQARLPFKILPSAARKSPSVELANTAVAASPSVLNEPRKRKLSSDSESKAENVKILCSSSAKESRSKSAALTERPVIVLDDDNDNVEQKQSASSKHTGNVDHKVSSSNDKFCIKVPTSLKTRRKRSTKHSSKLSKASQQDTPEKHKAKRQRDEKKSSEEKCNEDVNSDESHFLKSVTSPSETIEVLSDSSTELTNTTFVALETGSTNSSQCSKNVQKADTTNESEDKPRHIFEREPDSETSLSVSEEKQAKQPNAVIPTVNSKGSKSSENVEATAVNVLAEIKTPIKPKSLIRELTPKQQKRLEEREMREKKLREERVQRQKEKEGKESQRKREKEEKEDQKRKEREEKEEAKRKEREEKEIAKQKERDAKEEAKRREKDEREKKRVADIEAKNDERKKRGDAKDEERKKREDERKKKELDKKETKNKQKKAAEAFTKFFVQKSEKKAVGDAHQNTGDRDVNCMKFMPFQVKGHMKLAPLRRRFLSDEEKRALDSYMQEGICLPLENLYVKGLKTGQHTPGMDARTCSTEEYVSDVLIVDDELEAAGQNIDESKARQKFRVKYFLFKENRRPPYYGTWTKQSKIITGRNPFAVDNIFFDYDVDSDDEWEEEEPGESLHGSEDEKESEDEDYEVDNEFFVPHGHLSDEEIQNEDEAEDNTPEAQKAKLNILQQEFAREMKKKTEKIKPKLVGIVWADENGNKPDSCSDVIWHSLRKREMMFYEPIVLPLPGNSTSEAGSPFQEKKTQKLTKLPEGLVCDLIKLVHGNRKNNRFMIEEFQEFIATKLKSESNPVEYTNVSIKNEIHKISEWKKVYIETEKKDRFCWVVRPEMLQKYEMDELKMIDWSNQLTPKRKGTEVKPCLTGQKSIEPGNESIRSKLLPNSREKSSPAPITKFTKILSEEEKQKKFTAIVVDKPIAHVEIKKTNVTSSPASSSKKRVALLRSFPRNQQSAANPKHTITSQFSDDRSPPSIEIIDDDDVFDS